MHRFKQERRHWAWKYRVNPPSQVQSNCNGTEGNVGENIVFTVNEVLLRKAEKSGCSSDFERSGVSGAQRVEGNCGGNRSPVQDYAEIEPGGSNT